MEPKHIAYAVGGGIALIIVVAWIVEHNLEKALQQQPDPNGF